MLPSSLDNALSGAIVRRPIDFRRDRIHRDKRYEFIIGEFNERHVTPY
jgi:hypothetical protein